MGVYVVRRDVCYYFPVDVRSLYNAYLSAATNPQFRRGCTAEPYKRISFGLNFSMKYNFNGGACNLHFIPYGQGSAVDLRFSIAQLAGARYGRYAEDLTKAVEKILGVSSQPAKIDIEQFLSDGGETAEEPVTAAPVAPSAPLRVCTQCGTQLNEGDVFCKNCGQRYETPKRFCSDCGKELPADARFCPSCGKKQ